MDHFLTGSCILKKDPNGKSGDSLWPVFCLDLKAGMDARFRTDKSDDNVYLGYGEAYGGLHLTDYFSLHGRVHRERLHYIRNLHVPNYLIDERETDELFLQLGNNGLSRFRFAAGVFELPFGLNQRHLPKIYYELDKSEDYWDFGAASNRNPFEKPDKEKEVAASFDDDAVSGRLMVDLAALSGTRLIFSGYGNRTGQRRVGAAILNRAEDLSLTSFEWVRIWQAGQGDLPDERRQLLRFTYEGPANEDNQWLFEYEDDLHQYWLTTLGHNFSVTDYGLFQLSASYNRARLDKDESHWFIVTGVQVHL